MLYSFILASLLISLASSQSKIEKGPLLWSDEFNYEGPPDSKNWFPQIDLTLSDNPKLSSCYLSKNAYVTGGNLTLVIKKESKNGKNYTAGAIWSKRGFQYGIFEARIKLGIGRGAWSNFWFLSDTRKSSKWPADGEIDVAEVINTTNYQYGRIHGSVHNDKFDNQIKNPSTYRSKEMTGSGVASNPTTDFHVYTLEWNKDRMNFYLDNVQYYTYKNDGTLDGWPFDTSMTLIFNNKLGLPGDTFSGFYGIDDSIFPLYHYVDYVRHYALPDTIHSNKLNWQYLTYYGNVSWAPGCDFPGNDLKYELTKIPVNNQCEGKCRKTTGCSHFVWNEGICYMKKGPVTENDAVNADPNMVCAIVHF